MLMVCSATRNLCTPNHPPPDQKNPTLAVTYPPDSTNLWEKNRGAQIWGMGTRENSCQLGHHSLVVILSVLIAVQFAVETAFTVSRR